MKRIRSTAARVLRAVAVAATVPVLAGCGIHPFHDRGTVRVRVGEVDRPYPDDQFTAHYIPYAIMAAEAYRSVDPTRAFNRTVVDPQLDYEGRITRAQLARWMEGWRFEGGEMGPLCADGGRSCGLPGLEYQIWTRGRRGRRCDEAALVFRGTDPSSLSDWTSNLHWVVRLTPIEDQYEQVQHNIGTMTKRIRGLCPNADVRIVSVGHSLGGGLAQQAAFVSQDIRHVYAFDPSFVTGSTDRHSRTEETRFGLKIDRIYEHGEVLAYPRFVWRMIEQPTPCAPQIRTIRLDALDGSMFAQHKMRYYVAALIRANERKGRVAEDAVPGPSAAYLAPYRCSDRSKRPERPGRR